MISRFKVVKEEGIVFGDATLAKDELFEVDTDTQDVSVLEAEGSIVPDLDEVATAPVADEPAPTEVVA